MGHVFFMSLTYRTARRYATGMSAATTTLPRVLTDDDLALLDFAARTYRHQGRRESDMLAELGLSPTAYSRRLNWLIDQPGAMAARPVLVGRLLRLRAGRRVARMRGSRANVSDRV